MTIGEAARRLALSLERAWDERSWGHPDGAARFEPYVGHVGSDRAVVRGRLLLGGEPVEPRPGEAIVAAVRRTLTAFTTTEVSRARLLVKLGDTETWAETDDEGYLHLTLDHAPQVTDGPWREGTVLVDDRPVGFRLRVVNPMADFGVISDLDDTIVDTGVTQPLTMLRRTLTGSALTRKTFPGAPELYRALACGPQGPDAHPVFYVSSSPWNLHHFLVSFLDHRGFPAGPLLLRDVLGSGRRRPAAEAKRAHIEEILALHPALRFVLIGDSGEEDARIYADVVAAHPGRIIAVYIHEVRRQPGDGRVERVLADWDRRVPVLLTRDFTEMAQHADRLRLLGGSTDVA